MTHTLEELPAEALTDGVEFGIALMANGSIVTRAGAGNLFVAQLGAALAFMMPTPWETKLLAESASLRTELERMRGLLDRARTRVPVGGRLYNDICASLSAGREGT